MKIYTACLATETNTFNPIPTGLSDFDIILYEQRSDNQHRLDSLGPMTVWQKAAEQQGSESIFGLMAFAQPGGVTTDIAYEYLRDTLLKELEAAGDVDIVLLALHGAMVAQSYEDCESDIVSRVRSIVGPNTLIGVELDLHCHLTPALVELTDLIVVIKEYPHTDFNSCAEQLFDLAVKTHHGAIHPTTSLYDCQMVGMYPTTQSPMREYVDAMNDAEKKLGILSVALAHGFPYGDVSDTGGKVLVITDNNPALAEKTAREFGEQFLAIRDMVGFPSLTLEESIAKARELSKHDSKPIVIADQSDNVGVGGPGDATFVLRYLLENAITSVAYGIFYDPQVVQIAKIAGVGSELPLRLGGKLGPLSGEPLDVVATVIAIEEHYQHCFPQTEGDPIYYDLGNTVSLRIQGVDIVVSQVRCQCYSPDVFGDMGIPLNQKSIVIPKSTQHFHGAFAPIASEILYMAAPGAVPPIVNNIPYRTMTTADKYPWCERQEGKE